MIMPPKTVVPTEVKAEFIRRLADAGLTTVEATSFVHPKWVPQLADAERLFPLVSDLDTVALPVLVPNERVEVRAVCHAELHPLRCHREQPPRTATANSAAIVA